MNVLLVVDRDTLGESISVMAWTAEEDDLAASLTVSLARSRRRASRGASDHPPIGRGLPTASSRQ
jgi:hypothetical protein